MIRGLAALAVLYCHARTLFMHSVVDGISLGSRVMYVLSQYGYSAVMVFFVLSGFLVGGSVVRATESGRWSWKEYLLSRGVRLYVVLVPALLLTTAWDRVGLAVVGDRVGNGDTAHALVTTADITARSGLVTFLGNLTFLQEICVPTFGSNLSLWSLTNEAWYYLIFPCLWLFLRRGASASERFLWAGSTVIMLVLVGSKISLLFPAWLLGVAVALLPLNRLMRSGKITALSAIPLLAVLGLVGLNKIPGKTLSSYAVALTFTLLLYALLHRREAARESLYDRSAALLAGCSYTLYLVHLPMLVCLRAVWTYDKSWPPDPLHWSYLCAACAACVLYAYLLARFTESKTDEIRSGLRQLFENAPMTAEGSSRSGVVRVAEGGVVAEGVARPSQTSP